MTPSVPTISSFSASSTTIAEGDSVTLSWVTNAITVSINQGVGPVTAPFGSITITPATTTTYTLAATKSAGSITATVTIIIGNEMSQAIQVVLEEVLPDIPETQTGDPYWCVKLNEPIPKGTLIEESYSNSSKANVSILLAEESYFFYLDLSPFAYYSHPVKYILVDKERNYEVYDASWWPRIGGMVPEEILKDVPDQEEIISGNILPTVSTGILQEYEDLPQLVSV